ncbi:Cyanogenic beta-glucosidase [Glycine max]|nr:Cyanogenic beta-glucosidase [Glycine max]
MQLLRVLPKGKLSAGVNHGVNYYNNLINELMANGHNSLISISITLYIGLVSCPYGLQPYVIVFHCDVPQALKDEYGGFLSPHNVDDFRDYAKLCFKEFGNRVKHWITLNEPRSVSKNGYANGRFAPGRCSDCLWEEYVLDEDDYELRAKSLRRDTEEEPFGLSDEEEFVGSGKVGRTTEEKLKHSLFGDDEGMLSASQKGLIGITLNSDWYVPVSKEKSDQDVACRGLDFMYGNITKTDKRYGSYISWVPDSLLKKVLNGEKYLKLYSYHYLIKFYSLHSVFQLLITVHS